MNDGEVECDVVTNEIAARLEQVHVSIKIIHFFFARISRFTQKWEKRAIHTHSNESVRSTKVIRCTWFFKRHTDQFMGKRHCFRWFYGCCCGEINVDLHRANIVRSPARSEDCFHKLPEQVTCTRCMATNNNALNQISFLCKTDCCSSTSNIDFSFGTGKRC